MIPAFVANAQQQKADFDNPAKAQSPQLFFDAQTTGVSRDGSRQMFSGQVVAIGSGVLITADRVEVDRNKNLMVCEGHVIVLTNNQVFTGDKIEYQMSSGNFRFVNATMVSNDNNEADAIAKRILGFTPKEMWFEKKRQQQLQKVVSTKEDIRIRFRERGKKQPDSKEVAQYARLLEQQDLIARQENPMLAKMAQRRRDIFKNRRKYWNRSARGLPDKQQMAYFRIQGHVLERVDDTVFLAEQAVWSPCNCEQDEEPAWGFRADRIEVRQGGYVDLHHPVLEIRGVPVLYLPFLKLPAKTTRQSGFLMPRFADNRNSGTIFSQPVFFVLNDRADATLTTEMYENRGTKSGIEMRYQAKEYSGWEFEFERMRDRLWLDNRAVREDMIDACRGLSSELCSAEKLNEMKAILATPANTWRGRKIWSGLQILAPRLSFVSDGTILSDHRYIEDLTLPDDYKDSFELGHNATYFSTASGRFHLDGENFYLGAGSDFGDNVRTNRSFDGYQLPARVKLQSRLFSLVPDNSLNFKGYGQVSLNHLRILDYNSSAESNLTRNSKLGSGFWQQAKFDYVSPIVTDSVVGIEHFADAEYRGIRHENLDGGDSFIHSWRTGLTFNLPMDGEARLPDIFQTKSGTDSDTRYLHHLMNWAVTFSVRPVVGRRGPYYNRFNDTLTSDAPFYYFYSDTDVYNTNFDDAAAEEDMMKVHRRVQLSTSHRWRSFLRGWKALEGRPKDKGLASEAQTNTDYKAQARRELLYTLDRPVAGADDMFGQIENDYVWYINRYRLEDYGRSEHMSFSANIAFDFEKQDQREEQAKDPALQEKTEIEREQILVDAWSELHTNLRVNARGITLVNINKYNPYTQKFADMSFSMGLPSFYGNRISVGYTITQDPDLLQDRYLETQEKTINYSAAWGEHLGVGITVAERLRENKAPEYQTIFRLSYTSLEDCWKVDLGRTKRFERDEREAVYLLQLSVLFLGENRRVGNFGNQIRRYTESDGQG